MKTIKLDKWQRIQYMLCLPLGEDRTYVTACQEHIDLTREAACEGMVLLKNENGVLAVGHHIGGGNVHVVANLSPQTAHIATAQHRRSEA